MITFNRLGNHGNLGNQLFEIASIYGIAERLGTYPGFPQWKYNKYFQNPIPVKPIPFPILREPNFHYSDDWFQDNKDYLGWLQSEKYFPEKGKVKEIFKFNQAFESLVISKNSLALSRKTIAISIRRGDYVGNKNYTLLPIKYYIGALLTHFPDYEDYNILFFSDDMDYCRLHFECLPNAYFSDGSDIEQLCLMKQCDNFIIANSTFSWWGAYLGDGKVIRPAYLFSEWFEKESSSKDFYPERWAKFDHKDFKIKLTDVEFHIPVQYDHRDRIENLLINLSILEDFDTNIIIAENKTSSFGDCVKFNYNTFHRTRILNDLAKQSDKPIIVNWDCDNVIAPMQIIQAVEAIRKGADMVYPYDGRAARIPKPLHKKISQYNDLGILAKEKFRGTNKNDQLSVGHAIFWNRKSFISGGMENEKMISYAPEDVERFERFTRLGFRIERIKGIIGHLDHYVGSDSSTRHEHYNNNEAELKRIRGMKDPELKEYVKTFEWVNLVS